MESSCVSSTLTASRRGLSPSLPFRCCSPPSVKTLFKKVSPGKMEAALIFLESHLQIFSLMKQSGVSGSTVFTGPGPWHLQVTAEECSSELFVLCASVAALFARR